MRDAVKIAAVLGIDHTKIMDGSMTLEPVEGGHFIARWEGAALLDATAAGILFGEGVSIRVP